MRKFLIQVIFSVIASSACGQDAASDSLLQLLKNAKDDTVRVDILYQLSEASINDKEVLAYARQALALAEKIKYQKGIADASNNIGYVYDNLGNNLLALEYYHESLAIRKAIRDKKGIAITLNNIGIIYSRKGENKMALANYLESIRLLEEVNDSLGLAMTLNNIASLFREEGDIPAAIDYHQKSLAIREKIKDYDGISACLNNIAYIYGEQGKTDLALLYYRKSLAIYESSGNKKGIAMAYNNIGYIIGEPKKSLEYYHKSLNIYEEIGNKEGIGFALNNIGNTYSLLNDKKTALDYYRKSLKIREEIGSKEGVATAYINIGKIYESGGDYDEAIGYYKKSLQLKQEIGQKQGIARALYNIGNIYFLQKDYSAAEKYCRQAIEVAHGLGYPVLIRDAAYALSKIYAANHHYQQAYAMHIEFKLMSDSISSSDASKAVRAMANQFEFDKKEAQIKSEHEKKEALSKKEIEKQKLERNYTMAGFSLLLAGSGLFVFLFSQRRKSKFLQTVAEVEMKALRAQMNPHFIFNSLNSIHRYMDERDHDTAGDYLTRFAKVMRLILENSQYQEVPLSDDLKALELYMQLEALRMNHKFNYEITVDEAIDKEITLIPPLILQPFVENAIWHGFSGKDGPCKLRIHITKDDSMLKCIVEDNGVGRGQAVSKEPVMKEKKSLGMKITRSRIDIINKTKKSKAGIELQDLEQGLRVIVTLPLELDD